jgi:translation initiation factor 3 subunit J
MDSHTDDWEVDVSKLEKVKSSWDDEDIDNDAVKSDWEEDDEPEPPVPVEEPPVQKPPKKSAAKAIDDKKSKAVEVVAEIPLDPVAEKLRQQRLVEEADFKNTTELFGTKKTGDKKSLDNFIPKSESDFLEYAELLCDKIRPYEKSFRYLGLLKDVMRLSMTSQTAAEAKEIASSVTAIANEKIKLEKEANAGKKKGGGKKKSLHMDKPDDDSVVNAFNSYDEYDEFM